MVGKFNRLKKLISYQLYFGNIKKKIVVVFRGVFKTHRTSTMELVCENS